MFHSRSTLEVFLFFFFYKMRNTWHYSNDKLPQQDRIFTVSNWFFSVRWDWVILVNRNNKVNPDDLKKLSDDIDHYESILDESDDAIEVASAQKKLEALNEDFRKANNPDYQTNWKCIIRDCKSQKDFDSVIALRKSKARNAKTNSIWSVMYATWWRSSDTPVEKIPVLKDWYWEYQGSD